MKFDISLKFPASVQSLPDSPGEHTDSLPCTVPLRVSSCVSAAVVDSGNTHAIISKSGGVCPQVICTYRQKSYSGHVSDSLSGTKQNY